MAPSLADGVADPAGGTSLADDDGTADGDPACDTPGDATGEALLPPPVESLAVGGKVGGTPRTPLPGCGGFVGPKGAPPEPAVGLGVCAASSACVLQPVGVMTSSGLQMKNPLGGTYGVQVGVGTGAFDQLGPPLLTGGGVGAGVRVGWTEGPGVGVGVADGAAVGADVSAGDAEGDAPSDGAGEPASEPDGDAEGVGEAAPESDGDAEAEGVGDAPPESDGDGDAPAESDGDGDGDGDGLTVYGAIAKVAVESIVGSQNGVSVGQLSTLDRGATCTVYCVWPLSRSPNGCSLTTTPPGPEGHPFVPKSWTRTRAIAPVASTPNSRSASRSVESTTVPVWSVTSK